jgi:chorismate mutase
MNLKNLSKGQKQYIALGAIAAVGLMTLIGFGIKVSLSSIKNSRQELNDLTDRIESADRSLSRQGQVRQEFAETMGTLKEHLQDAPPNRNYYSWATEVIHAVARSAHLEIDAIDEQSSRVPSSKGEDDKTLKLESYSLRISARGEYGALKRFLELIEKDHPLARVVAVDISKGPDPEIHDMQVVVQWPFNLNKITDAWTSIAVQQQVIEQASTGKMPVPPPPRLDSMTVKPGSSKE